MAACVRLLPPVPVQGVPGPTSDSISLMYQKVEAKKFREATDLFKTKIASYPSDRVSKAYNHLLWNLVHHGEWEKATDIYYVGREANLSLSKPSFFKLIHVCSERLDPSLYQALFGDFQLGKMIVDTETYNHLFHLATKFGQSEKVRELYAHMEADHVGRDEKTRKIAWGVVKQNLKQPIALETLKKCRRLYKNCVPIDFSSHSPLPAGKIKKIQEGRMAGSGTLKADAAAVKRWQSIDTKVRNDARNLSHVPDLEWICKINRRLGVAGGGVLRSGDERVTSGGHEAYEYASPDLVQGEMEAFAKWLQNSLQKCDSGKKNPIALAAQAFQRLVSIHPFKDQNGRTSRLIMDYILQRYNLPPATLGSDVLLGVFAFADNGQSPTTAVEAVLKGVQRSYAIIQS